MNSTNTPSCLCCIPSGQSAGPRMNLPLPCFLPFLPKASTMAWFLSLLWPSQPQCPKFSWSWGAGRCKTLAPTRYFHLPHKDQSVRFHQWILAVLSLHIKNPEHEASNSTLSGATFKSTWSCNLSPLPYNLCGMVLVWAQYYFPGHNETPAHEGYVVSVTLPCSPEISLLQNT